MDSQLQFEELSPKSVENPNNNMNREANEKADNFKPNQIQEETTHIPINKQPWYGQVG